MKSPLKKPKVKLKILGNSACVRAENLSPMAFKKVSKLLKLKAYNLKLSTYAVPLILGEIKRYIRDNSNVKISRQIKDLAYKILNFFQLFHRNFSY